MVGTHNSLFRCAISIHNYQSYRPHPSSPEAYQRMAMVTCNGALLLD